MVALVAATPPPATQDLLRYESSLEAMGTAYVIAVYGKDKVKLQAAVEEAFEEVQRLNQLLSNYRPTSEWSNVNREAADKPVPVSQELFDLLSACVDYSRRSEGTFDVTVGPLMKTWGFYRGSGRMPHRAEIRGALTKIGSRYIELDPQARTVRFTRRGLEMDPGGIGKGYAVDRMVTVLKANGITSALVSAGSSSIYALGAPPDEPKGWHIFIRHPKDENKSVAEVYLKNESMSTSGNYEKFFRANGRIYSHIMDPRTGYPAPGMLSASVIAPRTLDSEAWTKPYFIQGRAWTARHKPKDFRVFLCEDKTEQACAWVQ